MSREDPQLKVRLPAELKNKITESANELGRSINADVVARLEQSFETPYKNFAELRLDYFQKSLINLDYHLFTLDAKINSLEFLIKFNEKTPEYQEQNKKYEILLEAFEIERKNIFIKIKRILEEEKISEDFINENELTRTVAKVKNDLARAEEAKQMQKKYPNSWG